jgi:hypothetical protein
VKYLVIRYVSGAMGACEQSAEVLSAAYADKTVLCFMRDIEVTRIGDAIPAALHRIVAGRFELSVEGQRICTELVKSPVITQDPNEALHRTQ